MERLRHLPGLQDAQVAGQERVERLDEDLRRVARRREEMDDLAQGVDPGVGPAAGGGGRPGLGQLLDGRLERLLDGPQSRLALPAVEVGSVVGEGQLEIPHGTPGRPGLRCAAMGRRGAQARAGSSLSSSSAIWTALVAAPLRRLSLTHQKRSTLGRLRSRRIRPTKTSSRARGLGRQRVFRPRRVVHHARCPGPWPRGSWPPRPRSAAPSPPGSIRCARMAPVPGRRSG